MIFLSITIYSFLFLLYGAVVFKVGFYLGDNFSVTAYFIWTFMMLLVVPLAALIQFLS